MVKIILFVGLPGSGKTTLAQSMMDNNSFLIDDPNRDTEIFNKAIGSNKEKILVCDPLLIKSSRITVERFFEKKFKGATTFEWIYFENNPEAAWNNHLKRNETDPRDISHSFFMNLSKLYIIPNGVIPLKIYQGKSESK